MSWTMRCEVCDEDVVYCSGAAFVKPLEVLCSDCRRAERERLEDARVD
jgi:hypothetical protein